MRGEKTVNSQPVYAVSSNPVVSKYSNGCSSGVPIIVVEHAADVFPSADRAFNQTDLVYLPSTFLISATFFWALPSI
jgi:hypothetical protein